METFSLKSEFEKNERLNMNGAVFSLKSATYRDYIIGILMMTGIKNLINGILGTENNRHFFVFWGCWRGSGSRLWRER
tara:strand:+ start:107 stop:340 length:234 start_codon:yes stop_codon:yes gene_type:complete